ncbi:MAG: MFS transporter [Dehalococcoidales bacterium]|nr:MFS transporter [Dehalococcoidales bacterium]
MGGQPRIGLWRHRNFLKLWTGQSISQLGSQMTLLALPLTAALLLNASPLEMGILSAVEMAPFLLIGLPAGVWVDRWPRRPLLIAGDVGRALVLVTVPVGYFAGLLTMGQLYVVAFASGILTVFFDVAYMSYLPSLVERDQLTEGNSKLETTRAGAEIAGPGLAGTLVDLLSAPLAIAFDALSYVVSAAFVWNIKADESAALGARAGQRNGLWVEVGEGLRYVLTHAHLRSIAGCTATSNLFSSALGAVYILFAVHELKLEPATIGLIFAVGNVGFLIGAALAGRVADRLGLGPAIVVAALQGGLGQLLIPLATPATAVQLLIAAGLIRGLAVPVYNINQVSLRQAITPDRLQGRMNATMRFVVWGTLPIGALLGGTLGEAIGLRPTIAIVALGGTLSFLLVLLSPVRALQVQPTAVEL